MSEPEKKRCPFCAGEPILQKTLRDGYADCQDDPDAWAHYVICRSCAAQGGWAKSESGAWRLWNLRTPSGGDAVWTRRWPLAEGAYWFYGFRWKADKNPTFNLVRAVLSLSGMVYVSDGAFLYEQEVGEGLWAEAQFPERPRTEGGSA